MGCRLGCHRRLCGRRCGFHLLEFQAVNVDAQSSEVGVAHRIAIAGPDIGLIVACVLAELDPPAIAGRRPTNVCIPSPSRTSGAKLTRELGFNNERTETGRVVRSLVKPLIAVAAVCVSLAACSSGNSTDGTDAPKGISGGIGLQYGTDDYSAARIKLYEGAGLIEPGVLTADHLPWDPSGPTVQVTELTGALRQATLIDTIPDTRDGYADFSNELDSLVLSVQEVCAGGLTGWDAAEYVDETIAYLRFGSNVGSSPVDASGGIKCEDGHVAGGTGHPIFVSHDQDNYTLTGGLVVQEPLVP